MAARRSRRGATLLEFALLLPVFLMLVLGSFDSAWLAYRLSSLDAAAASGCRAGALVDPGWGDANLAQVETTAQDAIDLAMEEAGFTGGCDPLTCVIDVQIFDAAPSRSIDCRIQQEVQPIVGMFLQPVTISSRKIVRMEWQR
jgi:hypothetical protein